MAVFPGGGSCVELKTVQRAANSSTGGVVTVSCYDRAPEDGEKPVRRRDIHAREVHARELPPEKVALARRGQYERGKS